MTTKIEEMKELEDQININQYLDCPLSSMELFSYLRELAFGFENIIEAFELYKDEFTIDELDINIIDMYEKVKNINLIILKNKF